MINRKYFDQINASTEDSIFVLKIDNTKYRVEAITCNENKRFGLFVVSVVYIKNNGEIKSLIFDNASFDQAIIDKDHSLLIPPQNQEQKVSLYRHRENPFM